MVSGLTAGFAELLMSSPATATDLDTDTLVACLFPSAARPVATELQADANTTVGQYETLLADTIEFKTDAAASPDGAHCGDMGSITIGDTGAGTIPFVFDAADTVIDSAAAGVSETKDVMICERLGTSTGGAGEIDTNDLVLAYFAVASPQAPNGQNYTVQWDAAGIWQYGGEQADG